MLQKLIGKQKELGMTDAQFAVELGVSRQLWQLTRTEKVAIGVKVLRGTRVRFPDLIPELLIFLGDDVSKIAPIAS